MILHVPAHAETAHDNALWIGHKGFDQAGVPASRIITVARKELLPMSRRPEMSNEMNHNDLPVSISEEGRNLFFGLGCIQFIPKQKKFDRLTIGEFCDMLDRSLWAIPAIGDVSIIGPFEKHLYVSGEIKTLREGGYLWPSSGLEVIVPLHIPYRVQEDVTGDFFGGTKTEDFKLQIRYEYHSPVAIVSSATNAKGTVGSQCLFVVKKFLEKALSENPSSDLLLDIEGPSPFHADFAIVAAPD